MLLFTYTASSSVVDPDSLNPDPDPLKILFCKQSFSPLNTYMRKGKDLDLTN
jgi:hypothetical protein